MAATLRKCLAILALANSVAAFWRMECRGPPLIARIDPLMSPGEVSQHAHTIWGSKGFYENATYEDLRAAECSTCGVKQDMSVYWHPQLYFQDDATQQFEAVPATGGMLAYYNLNPGADGRITAFPNGLRMIAGDSLRRNMSASNPREEDPPKALWAVKNLATQPNLAEWATGFNCLNYNLPVGERTLSRHFLPDKSYLDANCIHGTRFELAFPSCWNGKDLDTENHKDHVAYSDQVIEGNCPSTHPIKMPGLMYETIYNTPAYAGRAGKFVIGNGDPQGFGYHGDFMSGWEQNFLQQAVDQCRDPSGEIEKCAIFEIVPGKGGQCNIPVPPNLVNEDTKGPIPALPGNVAIQAGPGPATVAHPTTTSFRPVPSATFIPDTAATPGQAAPGGVFHASSDGEPAPAPSAPPAPPADSAQAQNIPAPTPETTPAPSPNFEAVSTQWLTNGNIVSEVVWEEAVVYVTTEVDVTSTVTVTPTAGSKARRSFERWHRHLGRHGRHI